MSLSIFKEEDFFMRIQHNIMAMNAYRNYTNNTSALSKNLEKLSSGYKINRAGDDAAGLAISEKMRAQITGLDKAQDNAKDGISLVQTAEGALTEVHDMLNRMVELATQSANGTSDNDVDRDNLQKEMDQLKSEIDRIADSANFNGIKLLDGSMEQDGTVNMNTSISVTTTAGTITSGTRADGIDLSTLAAGDKVTINGKTYTMAAAANADAAEFDDLDELRTQVEADNAGYTLDIDADTAVTLSTTGKDLTLQIGDTSDGFNQLKVSVQDMHVDKLGLEDVRIDDQTQAQAAVSQIKDAINIVSSVRGTLGATQNRLDHTINNLSVMEENIQDAESSIRDTDVAEEMMAYTKNNILVQSAQAMLAQANQVPQGVLQLLQ